MKIIVFSDSHGDISRMREVIAQNRSNVDLVIHLGDKICDIDEVMKDYPTVAKLACAGNCDGFSLFYMTCDIEHSFTLEDFKLYMTHGHQKDVKSGIFSLIREAKTKDYDIVLYGHTHIARHDEIDGVHYFNPGSISCPRGSSKCSYGIIELSKQKADFSIIEVE